MYGEKISKVVKKMIISREDEANFPQFSSVDEARAYFQKRYGKKYSLGYSQYIEGVGVLYFDKVDGQPVEISEDGFIHVVY